MVLSLLISLVIAFSFWDSAYTSSTEEINGTSSENTTPCEKGWYFIEDNCYKIEAGEDDRTSWENASARCSELGGKLASIHSKKHNDLLTAFLVMNVKQTVWIGLNDKEHESTFSWEDETAFDYRNWELGQPDNENRNEHCVQLYADPFVDKVGKWNDFPCTARLGYICQKDRNNSLKAADLRFCTSDRGGGWKFRNSCYNIINESKSWDDAELYCQSTFKGHLVMISDLPRNFFLGVLLSNYKSGLWIGIKTQRMYHEKWSSGWPVAYGHFDRSLQVIESGTCILRMKSNLWIPVNCTEVHPFICEINSKGPPILKQSTPKAHCPALPLDWRDLGGDYCYYIDTENRITWYGAQAICIRRGGLLASINSKEEEELLHPFIRHKQESIFIGLNTFLTNGNLSLWSDGSVPRYTHWPNAESYGYRPKCAEVMTADMSWNIVSCSSTTGYICQIKKITETSVDSEDIGENSTIIETTTVEEEINANAEEEINEPEFRPNGLNNSLEKLIPCEKGWYYFNETCYKIEGYTSEYPATTYADASFRCSFLGGKLVSIHSKEENDFLTTFLILSDARVTAGWIGLNDKERESNFTWEDESQVDYLNWNTGEPDNMKFNEDCVYLLADPNSDVFGKWYDIPCTYKKGYICQKESNKTFQTPDPQFCSFGDGSGSKFRNVCYNIISDPESWDDAELYCQSALNGHLVSILDRIHDHFLEIMLSKFKSPLWIGIKTQDQYQQKWVSGPPVAYSHFDMVLEDIPVGTCLIRWNENLWTTEDCAKKKPFICEINTDRHRVLPQPSQELHCPEVPHGWRDLGGEYCYYINTKNHYSWYEAQSRCISLGGLLATINSKEIEQILHHFIKNTQERIFIGINSLLTNGDIFFWSDGTQLNYTNWNDDEPNSRYEMCGELWTHNMKWNDIPCGFRKGFICQTKKVNNTNEANEAKVEKEVTTQSITIKSDGEKIKESKNKTIGSEDGPGVTKSEVKETTKYKDKEVNSEAPMKAATEENGNKGNREEVTRNSTFDTAAPTRKVSITGKEEKHDVTTVMAARSEEEETKEETVESHSATKYNKEENKMEGNDEITFPSNITANLENKAEEHKEYAPSSTSGATARGLYVGLVFIAALLGIWAYYSRKWIKHKTNILATVFYRPSASFKELRNKWSAEIMLDKNGEETYM